MLHVAPRNSVSKPWIRIQYPPKKTFVMKKIKLLQNFRRVNDCKVVFQRLLCKTMYLPSDKKTVSKTAALQTTLTLRIPVLCT